jgi:hypothetical protein
MYSIPQKKEVFLLRNPRVTTANTHMGPRLMLAEAS